MKKLQKFLAVSMAAILTFGLCACEKPVESAGSASTLEETSASASTEASVETPAPEAEAEAEYLPTLLKRSYYYPDASNKFFIVKGTEVLGEYDVPEIMMYNSWFLNGDYIFFQDSYDGELADGDLNSCVYKAYNYKTGETKDLVTVQWGGFIDFYDGKIILTAANWYAGQYREYWFDPETLEELECTDTFWDNLPYDAVIERIPMDNTYFNAKCAERMVDETGYIKVKVEGEYYNYDGKTLNRFTEFPTEDSENQDILNYDGEHILYTCYEGGNYDDRRLVCINLNTNDRQVVSETYNTCIGTQGSVTYFTEEGEGLYGQESTTIYSYDIDKSMKQKVVTLTKKPGDGNTYYASSVTVLNGDTLYTYSALDTDLEWSLIKDGKLVPLGIDKQEFGWIKYGHIDAVSYTELCEFCGNPIYQCYAEYPVLDASVGPKAAELNKLFEERAKTYAEEEHEADGYKSTSAEDCEDMGHGQYYGKVTFDRTIRELKTLGNYLVVNSDGYWYGGGAHGMPYMDSNLYDLTTGVQVTIKDIFPGTEEDLKRIVAEKTKEDFLSYSEEDRPYAWDEDADAVYQHAYEYISFANFPVTYDEGKLWIEYPPYEMSSYAAGFIEVPISYEDLGITALK
ncbi:MAG: DUF3298 domain-containing protein [Lachnospiraceae bacterium]|nr:DUF3298 domain-containing protein [Lachnospiraceae bacterium]